MAYTTIDNGKEHFNIALYTGTGSSQAITGVGFQPDWVWTKGRSVAYSHYLFDSSRGVQKRLMANHSNAEDTLSAGVTAFGTDGFTHGGEDGIGENTKTFVGWCWKANGGTTTTNDASSTGVGTIDSVYQANTTAGLSIVTYTGTGSAGTIAHGLGVVPKLIICKARGQAENWAIYHGAISNAQNYVTLLNETTALSGASNAYWNSTSPTSSVFSVNTATTTNAANTMVAYCFAEVKGYSQIGTFTGNGSTNGPFIYTGFKPRFLLFRSTSTCHWVIVDSARSTSNVMVDSVYTDTNGTEITTITDVDFYSNGFKWRGVLANETNVNGQTYIYYAIAENPFVSSKGIPTTAR